MQLHKNFISALEHASTWAGFAGVMSSVGTQLDKPYSITCFSLSALCSLVAILVKTPDGGEKENTHDNDRN